MNAQGKPTQIHAVHPEERARDERGGYKPWAELYHEDHPKGRGQKRYVEEKGAFGKSTRRKGTSRTRTATPAKKENPTLEGFDRALKTTAMRAAEKQEELSPASAQHDGNVTKHRATSYKKEPTQIFIYGYNPSTQWKALDVYERISGGMICEDYPREPPAEYQKLPRTYSTAASVHPRKLTEIERKLAFEWKGGESWVRLTCDSAEAADRAVFNSPQNIYGHWVHAELWQGRGPAIDQPILIRDGEHPTSRRPPQTLSAAFSQQANQQQRATATLPRSFNPTPVSQAAAQMPNDPASTSPSTVSSATATGPEYPDLRNRAPRHYNDLASSFVAQSTATTANMTAGQHNPAMMRYFPDRPRTVLRPASEAFLPQPTWLQRQLTWLSQSGLVPGDFIGDVMPLNDNGEFDWAAASWYWRACKWIDDHLGSDICGLKDS